MKKNHKFKFILSFIFAIAILEFSFAQETQPDEVKSGPVVFTIDESRMPSIPDLNSKDPVFKEFSYIVEDNYKHIAKNEKPEIYFFKYKVTDNKTLIDIASRCNITYDTIASVNKIETSNDSLKDKTIYIPTAPGLFVLKNKGTTSLEILLTGAYASTITEETPLYKINGTEYYFLINKRFSPTERAYFLDATLRLPLDKDKFTISSDYGMRRQPFSGEWKSHKGVDLAAPTGTKVYAIKDGFVSAAVYKDPTFGNFIMINHDNGKFTSVYAHLSKINVIQGNIVKKGEIIGEVGQTGLATGPHLHFEIRKGGVSIDPKTKLNF